MSTTLRTATSTIALLIALLASIALAPSAEASTRPIDITGYTVADQVISSSGCRYVSAKMTTAKKKDFSWSFESHDVTRGGDIVTWLSSENGKGLSRMLLCPGLDGLGTYTVGPAEIDAAYTTVDRWGYETEEYRHYVDGTKKSFSVRGKSTSSLSSSRKGRTVTLTAKASSYDPAWGGYRKYNPKSAKLQVKSGSTWKTVKTVKLSSGKATVKVTSSATKQYRFTFPKTSTRTGATSGTVKR